MSEQSGTTSLGQQIDGLLDAAGKAHASVMIHRAHGAYYAKVEGVDGALGRGETVAAAVADAFEMVGLLVERAAAVQS